MSTRELHVASKRLKSILLGLLCCIMIGSMVGCGERSNQIGQVNSEEEEMDTGAWESGTVYYNDYKIDITGPKVGHPSGETLWSTYYEDDDKNVDVDFYGKEGSLEERIEELTAEGIEVSNGWLWGHEGTVINSKRK